MRRAQRSALLLGSAAVVLAALAAEVGLPLDAVLWMVPATVLAVLLLAGCYAGEELIVARRARRLPRARRAAGRVASRPAPRAQARGGRLIAFALAERGPPVPAGA